MNRSPDIEQVLDRLSYPALIVEEGTVTYANTQAQQLFITVGSPIDALIAIGSEEYAQYSGGALCLTLSAAGIYYSTTVIRSEDYDIFYLESEASSPEMKAFALAAQYLRESLSGALQCADLLRADASEEAHTKLDRLNKNLHQLHRTICNMSDVGDFEAPRPTMTRLNDATALFAQLLEKAAALVAESGRTLRYTLPNECISTMLDTEKVERAVYNLISNALKYEPAGETICASVHRRGNKVLFSVENCKSGISYGNIFSRFQRQAGLERTYSGIGLGLTIARKAAAAHNGTLLLDQTQDGHPRFTISLSIQTPQGSDVRSPIRLPVDYAGGYDHALVELSDVLPPELYKS